MASAIDATKPVQGNATTASVRANFTAAKSEIEALQALVGIGTSSGQIKAADGSAGAPSYSFSGQTATGFFRPGTGNIGVSSGGDNVINFGTDTTFKSDRAIGWASGDPFATAGDTVLRRDAANVLAQRNGVNAQAFRLYNTFTDASNYERLSFIATSGGPQDIVSEAAGTGTVRNLRLNPGIADVQWGKALVALGGGATPTLGTIGGSGPATAAQNSWMRIIDSTGAAFWVPGWK